MRIAYTLAGLALALAVCGLMFRAFGYGLLPVAEGEAYGLGELCISPLISATALALYHLLPQLLAR